MTSQSQSDPGRGSVSILIPVFNGEDFLGQAIDSALAQTRPADQLLVVDNCSTDASLEIARGRLPEEAIVTSDENLGAVANFNRSIELAECDYVLLLAADDRLAPTHLEKCVAALSADPGAAACLPGIRFIDLSGAQRRIQFDGALGDIRVSVRCRSFLRRWRWTEFYCLYRRETLRQSPMLTNEWGTDVLLSWWFLLRGPLAVVEEPLLEYREYDKTPEEMAHTIDPSRPVNHWRMAKLWGRLWAMTRDPQIASGSRRSARIQLILALSGRDWIRHLSGDVLDRWPRAFKPVNDALRLARAMRAAVRERGDR